MSGISIVGASFFIVYILSPVCCQGPPAGGPPEDNCELIPLSEMIKSCQDKEVTDYVNYDQLLLRSDNGENKVIGTIFFSNLGACTKVVVSMYKLNNGKMDLVLTESVDNLCEEVKRRPEEMKFPEVTGFLLQDCPVENAFVEVNITVATENLPMKPAYQGSYVAELLMETCESENDVCSSKCTYSGCMGIHYEIFCQ